VLERLVQQVDRLRTVRGQLALLEQRRRPIFCGRCHVEERIAERECPLRLLLGRVVPNQQSQWPRISIQQLNGTQQQSLGLTGYFP
jgi:hypothetical protein